MNRRIVEQELLETLPGCDPHAIRGREDLLVVNAVMGNHRWIERAIRTHAHPGWSMTELGAGDGALSLRLFAAGLCGADKLHAVDLAPAPSQWPEAAHWRQGDLFAELLPDSQIVIANLFLHHFSDDQLRMLGAVIPPSVRLLIAAEPSRRRVHTVSARCFAALADLNHITKADMQTSIRAGFRGAELRNALGLGDEWEVDVDEGPLGAYRFVASRAAPPSDQP